MWEPSLESCICQRSPLTPDNPDCLYPCSDGTCCPAGTFCGDTVAGYTICVDPDSGGTCGGDSVYICSEPDTNCNPSHYCSDNGWTTTPTSYLLEDVIYCDSRIDCEDVETYAGCYEVESPPNPVPPDPSPNPPFDDTQTLQVSIGTKESGIIEQEISANILENSFKKIYT